jgi:anthranilate phosphoribosyltransferase
MKRLIEKSMQGQALSYQESYQLIEDINTGIIQAENLAALLISIQIRGVQLNELTGLRDALLHLATPVSLDGTNAIDLCGTGGDGKDTFNISTTTSLVLAAMGIKVIKHGNYGVSSICGSSNVLEELGFPLTDDLKILESQLNNQNFCFLHAPMFHPTLKAVASVRKNLGLRTIFNSLGPLVNPVQPEYQLTGTFSLEIAQIYQYMLKDKRKSFKVVHSLDGYDEITLTDTTRIYSQEKEINRSFSDFDLQRIAPSALLGGKTIKESAHIIRTILSGNGTTEQNNIIACNAAEALQCLNPDATIKDLFKESLAFIHGGHTSKHFNFN